MLDAIPGPLQAIAWPLVGAAVILVLGRLLPGPLRRLLSAAGALASLAVLWSLRSGSQAPVEIYWEPLNFFRLSPTLVLDGLSVTVGLTLAAIAAAGALGMPEPAPRRPAWHSLILIALTGCLGLVMAGNLLTLALGSALIDLALVAIALTAEDEPDRVAWRMVVPGAASTLLLFFAALQMDAQVGSASLSALDFPIGVLVLVAAAGLLRMLIFPLHPRGLNTPASALTALPPVVAGIFLVVRAETIAPILVDQTWMLTSGAIALLVGGFLVWVGSIDALRHHGQRPEALGAVWPGIAVHQTGYALAFSLLALSSVPWPLLSLALVLAQMAVWWSVGSEPAAHHSPNRETSMPGRWGAWFVQRFQQWQARMRHGVAWQGPRLERWRRSWLAQHGTTALGIVGLASLAGVPLTAGALGRWSFYTTLLYDRQANLLLVALAADTFLAAGLWTALSAALRQSAERRGGLGAVLSMVSLAIVLVGLGIAPGRLYSSLGLEPSAAPQISVWGLGLLFVLPWLLGGWLARFGASLGRSPRSIASEAVAVVGRIAEFNWFYQAIGWTAQRLVDAIGWLGCVGEGEAWWGWALIILALGAMFLTVR
jgi:phosphate starvation-inducible membrane PsiE